MNLTTRAASCLAALAMTLGTQPASADPSVCMQPQPLAVCTVLGSHCDPEYTAYVVVLGAGPVRGLASCGNGPTQYVRCDGLVVCLGAEGVQHTGSLGCDVQTTLSVAICFTLPVGVPPVGPVVDSIVCPVLASLSPTVNVLPSVLYVESDGDVDVANHPFWDCPPYGS